MDGRSKEKHERKTQENTRTQTPSKIGTQKKCAIFEKSNAVVGSFSSTVSSNTTLFLSLDFSFNFSFSTTQSIMWPRKSASKLDSHLNCPFSNSLFSFLRLSSVLFHSHWNFTPSNIFQVALVLWIVINHLLLEIRSDENQGLFKSGEALSSSSIKITPLSVSASATMSSRKSIISF